MELQARLPLSVLLLSVVFVGLSASPVPIDLLSRLRRSVGSTTGSTLESGVPTTSESVSTEHASPSARVARQALSQTATADELSRHYIFLHVHATEVWQRHRGLYSNYKQERFAGDADPIVRDMGLSYLPNVNVLPQADVIRILSDSELVAVHYNNLIIFRDTLVLVGESESQNISRQVDNVTMSLRHVINRLETTMILNGNEGSIIRVPSSIPEFHDDVTSEERNMRTLFVLQEFHAYMRHVKRDYKILANRHQ